jgi:CheY-like chemotaxis protein
MDSPTLSHAPCHTPLRILHLEDDPDNTRLSQLKLNADGIPCQLYRVDNRADFVRALENGGFDLIFSDYCLPTFDGLAALALAREKTPDLPFIFITGAFNDYTAANLLKAGATDYVIKPNISKIALVGSARYARSRSKMPVQTGGGAPQCD